jgi:hypothetical protein
MNASTGTVSPGDKPAPPVWLRWYVWGPVLLAALALIALFAVKQSATGRRAELATGYIAHVVCSCRYVGNRDMASCETDFEPGTEIVDVKDDIDKRTVTASVPLLSKRTARYDPEYGCTLDAP